MSSTPPIERLNYFNGQRLDAADLRVEQDFHMRVRRLLNRSLFTPGIAAGLEVEKVQPEPSHAVVVFPGVALDSLGREIILVEPREVPVAGKPTEPKEPVTGNYLVIEYAEEAIAFAGDGCAVRLGVTCKATEDVAWGSPSRIRAEPHIYIQHEWPKTEHNKIVLAQLELNKDCSLREIRTFVRKYVAAAKPGATQVVALEGEKDIDQHNFKDLYFHISDAAPARASLFLRGAKFSSLFYSELGRHTHTLQITVQPDGAIPGHTHALGELKTTPGGDHSHTITADLWDQYATGAIDVEETADEVDQDLGVKVNMKVSMADTHQHTLEPGAVTGEAGARLPHTHGVTASADLAGVSSPARSGLAYTFLEDLQIGFDGKDITSGVLPQLRDRDGAATWPKLGTGKGDATDKLSAADTNKKIEGTGEIDLLRLGVDLAPGVHRLTFSVPMGGGRLQYNLYIS